MLAPRYANTHLGSLQKWARMPTSISDFDLECPYQICIWDMDIHLGRPSGIPQNCIHLGYHIHLGYRCIFTWNVYPGCPSGMSLWEIHPGFPYLRWTLHDNARPWNRMSNIIIRYFYLGKYGKHLMFRPYGTLRGYHYCCTIVRKTLQCLARWFIFWFQA